MTLIQVRDLHKTLDGVPVLRGVSFAVARGETLVVIGRSGGGKSVLLKHLIGLMHPDAGRVTVDGVELSALPERALEAVRLKFGMVFQGAALFDSLTAFENVAFPLREHRRLGRDGLQARVRECLKLVDLEGVSDQYPGTLSGGMKKRVGLARALALEPEIVLYDEPTAGLDRVTARGIDRLIRRLNAELGMTAVIVTHDLESALGVADRLALLDGGVIAALGTPEELKRMPDDTVQAFLKME